MDTIREQPVQHPRYRPPPPGAISRQPARTQQARGMMKEMAHDPAAQAREVLHLGFTVAPLLAGLDKYFNSMTDWEEYLDPRVAEMLGMSKRRFMRIVGAIEIAAGLTVAARPQIGSYVVAGWLGGIIGNLLMQRRFYDIALRDLGLLLGAVALGRLESAREG